LLFLDTTVVLTTSNLVITAHTALATKEFPPAQEIEDIEDIVVRDSDVLGEDIEVQPAAEEESGSTPGSWPSVVTSPSFSTLEV
jgi:hypothetical protein